MTKHDNEEAQLKLILHEIMTLGKSMSMTKNDKSKLENAGKNLEKQIHTVINHHHKLKSKVSEIEQITNSKTAKKS